VTRRGKLMRMATRAARVPGLAGVTDPDGVARARASFLAFALAWISCGTILFIVFSWIAPPRDVLTGVFGIVSIMLVFAAPVWLLVMLPLSLMVTARSIFCRSWFALLFGGACGALAVVSVRELFLIQLPWDGFYSAICALSALSDAFGWYAFTSWLRKPAPLET
jgi:hypothetical protein